MLRSTSFLLLLAITATACTAPTLASERKGHRSGSSAEEDVTDGEDTEGDRRGGRDPDATDESASYPLGDPEMGKGVVDGHQLVEGDLIAPATSSKGVAGLNAFDGIAPKWPGGVIAFMFEPGFPRPELVWQAIKHYEANTRVRFVQRTNEANFVKVFEGKGCFTRLGMAGGEQPLSLGPKCKVGNAVHEIGHVLGAMHEQSRSDRDRFIRIIQDNIDPSFLPQFRRLDKPAIGAYDFGSIMQYGGNAFSKNGKPTITKLDGSPVVSQRRGLSATDIAGIEELYEEELAKVASTRVDIRWSAKSPTAVYSLDVTLADGTSISPCVGIGSLGKLGGHAFSGRCIAANRTIKLTDVREFSVCAIEVGSAPTCASAPFDGTPGAAVEIEN